MKAVSERLGMNAETLRNWVRQRQVDAGERAGVSSEAAAEIRALRRRNAELEQTIEILKAATSFFVRECDPRNPADRSVCEFIDENRDRFGVVPICRALACMVCRSPRERSTLGEGGRRRSGPCGTPPSPRSWPATTNPTSMAGASPSRCTGSEDVGASAA